MRRSPRNLRIACDHRGLTHFGGIYFFHEFLQVLRIRRFLTQKLDYSRRNQRYSLSQMILALVYPLVLGLDRLETASLLHFNGTFQYLTVCRVSPTHRLCAASYSTLLTCSGNRCTASTTDCCRISSTYPTTGLA